MNRHVRVFRGLLRAYPDVFRSDYGDEMTRLFADQVRDAQGSGRPLGVARLWADSLVDVLMTAPSHHLRKEERVPQPVDLPSGGLAGGERRGMGQGPKVLLGLLPLWLLVFSLLAAPGFMEPAFANPPAALGVPLGLVLLAIALALTAIGVVGLRRVSSPAAASAIFLCFTVPAVLVIVLTPAMVLVVQNLS